MILPYPKHAMTLIIDVSDNGIGMTPEEMTRNLVRLHSLLT
jgi:HSP90 family molecular chaperone